MKKNNNIKDYFIKHPKLKRILKNVLVVRITQISVIRTTNTFFNILFNFGCLIK